MPRSTRSGRLPKQPGSSAPSPVVVQRSYQTSSARDRAGALRGHARPADRDHAIANAGDRPVRGAPCGCCCHMALRVAAAVEGRIDWHDSRRAGMVVAQPGPAAPGKCDRRARDRRRRTDFLFDPPRNVARLRAARHQLRFAPVDHTQSASQGLPPCAACGSRPGQRRGAGFSAPPRLATLGAAIPGVDSRERRADHLTVRRQASWVMGQSSGASGNASRVTRHRSR